MRILHTSDWHLGRTLHGVDLLEHQAAFVDHLVSLVAERDVDVVVVAGDVYDRAVPSVPSVRLLGSALRRLSEHAVVVVTPGNHDSAVRLGFAAELMRPGLHVLASVEALDRPVVVADEHGPVAFYGLPYLDPDTVRHTLAPGVGAGAGADAGPGPAAERPPLPRSHEAVVAAAMDRVRTDLASRPGTRSVVVAHAFVSGGEASESERDIRVGGVDSVPSAVLDGVDYVALGHLHGAQRIGASRGERPVIRYSGSPVAFSFGELGHVKSTALVDLDGGGGATVELVPAPVPRRLAEVTDTLEHLLDGRHDELRDAWLRVHVTDPVHPERLYSRVKAHFPHALVVLHEPVGAVDAPALRLVTAETDPLEVAADFVAFASGGVATDAELAAVRHAYETARSAEESA
ncbi:exonuclease SbcCD subunit D [Frigoribacterium sp. PhB116]|uniref:exonuclease SbcCD subunit D n=1 Tax=Frigoribacterium sp. PhB116 TaxID=2485174 RepID=UPI00105FC0FD|nr:exonuclease SbcCD subunit D [Frigoribacterium sp. PhB116]TDT62568.1 exodeoxyribonuclease I subunit D [Frigoribacterium sp. PhB116]